MAGHQKNTKFNYLAAYNQQNSCKYFISQKYTMKQKRKKKLTENKTESNKRH